MHFDLGAFARRDEAFHDERIHIFIIIRADKERVASGSEAPPEFARRGSHLLFLMLL
jgi:hypothetical protein